MYRYKWLHNLSRLNSAILQTLALVFCWALINPAWAADPIKVGFSMSLTGGRVRRQAGARRFGNLARRRERKGWIVGTPG
jgi:hypothetical protein